MIPPISIRPRRRTLEDKAISSVKDQLEDDPNNSVHEFKQIMEDIKRENPDLSVTAQQVLALERCAKLQQENDDKLAQRPRRSTLPESLRSSMVGALKTLHIKICQKESPTAIERGASEGWVDGVDISGNSCCLPSRNGDSFFSLPNQDSTYKELKTSIAPRVSVAVSDIESLCAELQEWDDEQSLASLANIERAHSGGTAGSSEGPVASLENSLRRQSLRSIKRCNSRQYSRQFSTLSSSDKSMDQMELFGVGEEDELAAEDEKEGSSSSKAGKVGQETSVPVNYTPHPRKPSRRASRMKQLRRKQSTNSSFASVDPSDFGGDFSAWKNSSFDASTCSKGDFSAWASSSKEGDLNASSSSKGGDLNASSCSKGDFLGWASSSGASLNSSFSERLSSAAS